MVYTFDSFLRNFLQSEKTRNKTRVFALGAWHNVGLNHDFHSTFLRTMSIMEENYGRSEEARNNSHIFLNIMTYLANHSNEFDQGDIAVMGNKQGLFGEHLLRCAPSNIC